MWLWTLAYVADHGWTVVDEEASIPPAHSGGRGGGHSAHEAHVLTLRQKISFRKKYKVVKNINSARGYEAIYILTLYLYLNYLLVTGRGRHLGGAGELREAEVLRQEPGQAVITIFIFWK